MPNTDHFIQGNRDSVFFSNASSDELSTYLRERNHLSVIVVNNCHFDALLIVKLPLKYLEFLIITKCRLDIWPSFENMPNLSYLEMSFSSLVEIPYNLRILQKLTVLRLSNNEISTLPPEIASLENLQVLDLSQNKLSYLPAEICSLRNLTYLNCSMNALTELPNNISNLFRLEVILLSQNKFTCLPNSFSLLKRLQNLNLRGNQFQYVPFCIFGCYSLKEFIFSCNQTPGAIPENLCKLSNLEILYLANNRFTKLPNALSKLRNLRVLDISENDIEHIPEEILNKCKHLTQLNFCSCKLNEIPESLGSCKNLQVLNISNNSIKTLPQNGADLKNLVSLDISGNNISIIPNWVFELKKLSHMSASQNLIEDLPKEFEEVARELRVLDISHNHFEQVSQCILLKDAKITYLQIDNNPVLNIPPEISNLRFLTHLSISHCPYIYELPDEIGYILKLRALILCSNNLLKLPSTLHKLNNLNYLDLSDNKFSRFPIVVCFIPHLKVLLYNNCCHSCTYSKPDPPGWFERTSFIDPTASMDKLGKEYINEVDDYFPDDDPKVTLEEALSKEEEESKIQSVKAEDIGDLVFKRGPHCIPKLISYLKFLVHLSLQQNGLYFLPDVFDKFNHLKRINLSDNNLRRIPFSLANCKTLTHIDLRNNRLTEINVPIYKLQNLKRLELSGNNFPIALSEVIMHSNLKALCDYLNTQEENSRKYLWPYIVIIIILIIFPSTSMKALI